MFGFLNVNKPRGPTSHDVVARIRRMLPKGTKIGHAGTLDPAADGVLVLCVGPATRLADHVQRGAKRYTAEVTLAAVSTTDDTEGEITPTPGAVPVPRERLEEALRAFVGRVEQVPPAHSAVHVDGRRAYKLARKGEAPDLAPRPVVIHAIELLSYEWPTAVLDVRCGVGTYIRALARDLGAALGVGGHLSRLTRTEVGPFRLDRAVDLDKLDPQGDLISPLAALEELPKVEVGDAKRDLLRMGRAVATDEPHGQQSVGVGQDMRSDAEVADVAAVDAAGDLIAIAELRGGMLRPKKVFPAE